MMVVIMMEYWVAGQASLVAQPPVIVVIHTCQAHAPDYDDGGDYDGILGRWPGQASLVAQPPVIVGIHTCKAHATDHHRYDDGGGHDDGYWDVGQANLLTPLLWSSTLVRHSTFAYT